MTRRARLAGRLAVLWLLGLAWLDPPLVRQPAPLDLIVLLDDSASMDRDFGLSAWTRLRDDWAVLPAGSRVGLLRFAADSVLELPLTLLAGLPAVPPRTLPLDRSGSVLETALEAGLRLADPRRPTWLVLLSDGRETGGQAVTALQRARAAGVPVYGLLPDPAQQADAWIEAVAWPARVPVGQRWPLTVTVAGSLSGHGRLHWQLDGVPAGETEVRLTAGEPTSVTAEVTASRVGAQALTVSLELAGDTQAVNNEWTGRANVTGLASVGYVTAAPNAPAAVSLQRGGWSVQVLSPAALPQADDSGVIVLDDVAVADLPAVAWQRLAQAVREQGTGLIVLGGPRSFGSGGYRHSRLEELLPVTAEATQPQPAAAVLFVVDKSGSMDQTGSGFSRLALARQAVLATARRLPAGDLVGLLSFDSEPRWLLPLAAYPDPVQALEQGWQTRATGGTRLRPALLAAVAALRSVPPKQRLLVLVSDGFIASEELADLSEPLADAGITVIALAVGDAAELAVLQPLAQAHGGRVLPVRDLALLPQLLPEAVGQQRAAGPLGSIQPQPVQPLPYPLPAPWPALSGYSVTRARSQATVYLRAPQGDPLLAGWQVGAGRVLVLPGGLGEWASAWPAWSGWGPLLGGLVEWVNANGDEPGLALRVDDPPGWLEVLLDATTPGQEWLTAASATLRVQDPVGQVQSLTLTPTAPGRYLARLPVTQTGVYRLTVQLGDRRLQHELWHAPTKEFSASDQALRDWQRQGELRPWPGADLAKAVPQPAAGVRSLLTVVALLAYLLLLLAERGKLNHLSYIIIFLPTLTKHTLQAGNRTPTSLPSNR